MDWLTATTSQGIDLIRKRREEKRTRLPVLRVSASTGGKPPAVYYLCPDINIPTGGARSIYRHVDGLNSIGIRAAVLHHRKFSCTWFPNTTRVVAASEVTLAPSDVLVIPEYYGHRLAEIPEGPRIVLLNLNAYLTFKSPVAASLAAPFPNADRVEAILVASRDGADYMRYAFPQIRVEIIRASIDGQAFYPSADPPGQVLAFMPRKRWADSHQVLSLLGLRASLKNWEIIKIINFSETETANALRRSSLFLSFSEQEGFGKPPAEAMASGCYVIGFTGLAGREFFDPEFSMPIEEDDVLAFAKGVESVIARFDRDRESVRKRGLRAAAEISARYSPERQLADIRSFYTDFLSTSAAPPRHVRRPSQFSSRGSRSLP